VPPGHDEPRVNPDDDSGGGPAGNVADATPAIPQTPAPGQLLPQFGDWIHDDFNDEQPPKLLDAREAQRILERVYPGMLRDFGVTGHTTVQLVVDRSGAVQPGSVTVQETTHEAFRDAAVRAAERFRFRPARVNGYPVAVRISIPIEWSIQP
jgi:TonB family protein